MMDELTLAARFGAALGLGVLLGLERERTKPAGLGFAGVRTIALIALAGALAAYFDQVLGLSWLALAVFVAVAALVTVSYAVTSSRGEVGITTEVTALIAFLLGALCLRGELQLAAGLAVATALILALKQWLHRLARRCSHCLSARISAVATASPAASCSSPRRHSAPSRKAISAVTSVVMPTSPREEVTA